MSDLRCANLVIAARLHSHAHQYMDYMVDNYLCLAKKRFEQSKNVSLILCVFKDLYSDAQFFLYFYCLFLPPNKWGSICSLQTIFFTLLLERTHLSLIIFFLIRVCKN